MPIIDAVVDCPVIDSFRVQQVSGIFDLPPQKRLSEKFHIEIPAVAEPWQIGVIVGPSGSGKSTIARRAFGDDVYSPLPWPDDKAIVDAFGDQHAIQTITGALTSVGFSSPPAWLKPYHVLSNGEKFRCDLARAILDGNDLIVFDEFTSVVDRTVAKMGSAAVSKALRSGKLEGGRPRPPNSANKPADEDVRPPAGKKFIAVTCHYDVVQWLEPD